jgi:hypothetical protein
MAAHMLQACKTSICSLSKMNKDGDQLMHGMAFCNAKRVHIASISMPLRNLKLITQADLELIALSNPRKWDF